MVGDNGNVHSPSTHTPLLLQHTMPETSSTSQQAVQQAGSEPNPAIPIVSVEQILSPEDKLILYAALQNVASELRRIYRERKKNK